MRNSSATNGLRPLHSAKRDGETGYAEGIVSKKKIGEKRPPDQFGALLGKLVQVPKSEMQAEEAKWEAMRDRLRKKGEAKATKARKSPPAR